MADASGETGTGSAAVTNHASGPGDEGSSLTGNNTAAAAMTSALWSTWSRSHRRHAGESGGATATVSAATTTEAARGGQTRGDPLGDMNGGRAHSCSNALVATQQQTRGAHTRSVQGVGNGEDGEAISSARISSADSSEAAHLTAIAVQTAAAAGETSNWMHADHFSPLLHRHSGAHGRSTRGRGTTSSTNTSWRNTIFSRDTRSNINSNNRNTDRVYTSGHREYSSRRFLVKLAQEERQSVRRFRVESLAAAAPASGAVSQLPAASSSSPNIAGAGNSTGRQRRAPTSSNSSNGTTVRSVLPPLPPGAVPLLSSTGTTSTVNSSSFIHSSISYDRTGFLISNSGGSRNISRSHSYHLSTYPEHHRVYIAAPSQATLLSLGTPTLTEDGAIYSGSTTYRTAAAAAAEHRRQVCASAAEARQAIQRRNSITNSTSRMTTSITNTNNSTLSNTISRGTSSPAVRPVSPNPSSARERDTGSVVPVSLEDANPSAVLPATATAAAAGVGSSHRDSSAAVASAVSETVRVNGGVTTSSIGRHSSLASTSSAGNNVGSHSTSSANASTQSSSRETIVMPATSATSSVSISSSSTTGSAAAVASGTRAVGSSRMQSQPHFFFHTSGTAPIHTTYSVTEQYPYFYTAARGRITGTAGAPSLVSLTTGDSHLSHQRSTTTRIPPEGPEETVMPNISALLPFPFLSVSGAAVSSTALGSTTAVDVESSSNSSRRNRRFRRHSIASAAAAPRRGEPDTSQQQQHTSRQQSQASTDIVAGTHFVTPLNALLRRGSFAGGNSSSSSSAGGGSVSAATSRRPSEGRGPPIPPVPTTAVAGRGSGASTSRAGTARTTAPMRGRTAPEPSTEEIYWVGSGETSGSSAGVSIGQMSTGSTLELPRDQSSSRSSSLYNWWDAPAEGGLFPMLRGYSRQRSVVAPSPGPTTPTLTPTAIVSPSLDPSLSIGDGVSTAAAASASGGAAGTVFSTLPSSISGPSMRVSGPPFASFPHAVSVSTGPAASEEPTVVQVRGGVPMLLHDHRQYAQLPPAPWAQIQQPVILQEYLQQQHQQHFGNASIRWLPDGRVVLEGLAADQFNTFRENMMLAAAQNADAHQENRGLSAHILQWLPEERYDPRRGVALSEDSDARECYICMMRYEPNERLRRLPCLHAFHADCVGRWLQEHTSCPLCRFEVSQGLRWDWSSPMAAGMRNTSAPARGFSSAAADASSATAASPLYPAGRHSSSAFMTTASPAAANAGRPRGRSGSTPAALSTPSASTSRSPAAAASARASASSSLVASSSMCSSAAAMSTSPSAALLATPSGTNASAAAGDAVVSTLRSSASSTSTGAAAATSFASLHVAAASLSTASLSPTIRSTAADAILLAISASSQNPAVNAQEEPNITTSPSSSSVSSSSAAVVTSHLAIPAANTVAAALSSTAALDEDTNNAVNKKDSVVATDHPSNVVTSNGVQGANNSFRMNPNVTAPATDDTSLVASSATAAGIGDLSQIASNATATGAGSLLTSTRSTFPCTRSTASSSVHSVYVSQSAAPVPPSTARDGSDARNDYSAVISFNEPVTSTSTIFATVSGENLRSKPFAATTDQQGDDTQLEECTTAACSTSAASPELSNEIGVSAAASTRVSQKDMDGDPASISQTVVSPTCNNAHRDEPTGAAYAATTQSATISLLPAASSVAATSHNVSHSSTEASSFSIKDTDAGPAASPTLSIEAPMETTLNRLRRERGSLRCTELEACAAPAVSPPGLTAAATGAAETFRTGISVSLAERNRSINTDETSRPSHRLAPSPPTSSFLSSSVAVTAPRGVPVSAETSVVGRHYYRETGQQSPPCSSVAAAAAAALVTAARSAQLLQPSRGVRPANRCVTTTLFASSSGMSVAVSAEGAATPEASGGIVAVSATGDDEVHGSSKALAGSTTTTSAAGACSSTAPTRVPVTAVTQVPLENPNTSSRQQQRASTGTTTENMLGRKQPVTRQEHERQLLIANNIPAHATGQSLQATTATVTIADGEHYARQIEEQQHQQRGRDKEQRCRRRASIDNACKSSCSGNSSSRARAGSDKYALTSSSPSVLQEARTSGGTQAPPAAAANVLLTRGECKTCTPASQQTIRNRVRGIDSNNDNEVVIVAEDVSDSGATGMLETTAAVLSASTNKEAAISKEPGNRQKHSAASSTTELPTSRTPSANAGEIREGHDDATESRGRLEAQETNTQDTGSFKRQPTALSPTRERLVLRSSSLEQRVATANCNEAPELKLLSTGEPPPQRVGATRVAMSLAAVAETHPLTARRRATQPIAITKAPNGSIVARALDYEAATKRFLAPTSVTSDDFTCALRSVEGTDSQRVAAEWKVVHTEASEVPTLQRGPKKAENSEKKEARKELCIDCRVSREDSPIRNPPEPPQEKSVVDPLSVQPPSDAGSRRFFRTETTRHNPTCSCRRRTAVAKLSTAFRAVSHTFIHHSSRTDSRPGPLRWRSPGVVTTTTFGEATGTNIGTSPHPVATLLDQENNSESRAHIAAKATEAGRDELLSSQSTLGERSAAGTEDTGILTEGRREKEQTALAPRWGSALSPLSSSCPSVASEHTPWSSPSRSAASSPRSVCTARSHTSQPPSSAGSSPRVRSSDLPHWRENSCGNVSTLATKAAQRRVTAEAPGAGHSMTVSSAVRDAPHKSPEELSTPIAAVEKEQQNRSGI